MLRFANNAERRLILGRTVFDLCILVQVAFATSQPPLGCGVPSLQQAIKQWSREDWSFWASRSTSHRPLARITWHGSQGLGDDVGSDSCLAEQHGRLGGGMVRSQHRSKLSLGRFGVAGVPRGGGGGGGGEASADSVVGLTRRVECTVEAARRGNQQLRRR